VKNGQYDGFRARHWRLGYEVRGEDLDDIHALGGNDAADERRFATRGSGIGNRSVVLPHVPSAFRACSHVPRGSRAAPSGPSASPPI